MTKDQLISELGTVAKSGTSSFIEAFEQNVDVNLIGQFGVGFYSVYLVADTVTVTSKNPEDDKTWVWESTADQTFTIAEAAEPLERGTRIVLQLKEDAEDYLETSRLSDILKKHSLFINYPIFLETEKEIEEEIPADELDDDEEADEDGEGDDMEVEEDEGDADDDEPPAPKTRKVTIKEDERMNENKPLWLRSADDIEESEYDDFFKVLKGASGDSLAHIHFSAEGEVEFKSILYTPKDAPPDAYSDYNKQKGAVSLYVRRVLITDEFEDLLPNYLGFVKGVVDSDSLPLNVNRETLQQSKVLKVIGKKLTRKAIAMLQELATKHLEEETEEDDDDDEDEASDDGDEAEDGDDAEGDEDEVPEDNEDYLKFFKNFGKFIKLGVAEDRSNQARLAKLLRFPSTNDPEGLTSLEAYVERMKDDQKAIYYIAGDDVSSLQKHPTIEKLSAKGYEVFLLTDPLDEHAMQGLAEFQSHKISDTSRATLKLDESDMDKKKQTAIEDLYKPLTTWYKDLLGDSIDKVVISKRLETSVGAVVAGDYGWTANMEKIMSAQVFTNMDNMGYMKSRKTFELNPNHPVVKGLLEKVKLFEEEAEAALDAAEEADDDDSAEKALTEDSELEKATKDSATLLYQTCLLNSGFSLPSESSGDFSDRLERLVRIGLGVANDEQVSEVEVEI